MTLIKNYVHFIFLFFLVCCNSKSGQSPQQNDSTKLFQAALKASFYHGNLPGIEVFAKNDSIVITSDSLFLKFIPRRVDNFNFKILSRGDVCSFLKDSTNSNYLNIRVIEKEDSIYYINVQNLSCKQFGGGGSIGIYFLKVNDSFIIKKQTSSSIN